MSRLPPKGQRPQSSDEGAALTSSQVTDLRRLLVRAGDRRVPLFQEKPLFDSQQSPWTGLIVEGYQHQACEIPVHDHETLCLHFQTSREVELEWFHSGRTGRVPSVLGNMMLLPAGTRDSVIWHGGTQRVVTAIEPALLKDVATQMELKGLCEFDLCWAFQDEQLGSLLKEMRRETKAGWPMGGLYGDLLGMALSVVLIRKYGKLSNYIPNLKGGLSRHHMKLVMAYIDENLERDIRLQELAGLTALSQFHFARSFRETSGDTPYQYILQRRIQRAKHLLMKTNTSIADVAKVTGFSNSSQFARMFKKMVGQAPLSWRKG
jgi:AraC family transcriptional regulator